jgi:anaphase-promoting complex subunit 1
MLVLPYARRLQLPATAPADDAAGPGPGGQQRGAGAGEEHDGLEGLSQALLQLRFGRDDRLRTVRGLLASSSPQPLSVDASDNDPELQAKQQAALAALAARTLALPLGRGALGLGTLRPLPGEGLAPPPLCLSGVVRDAPRCVVALDLASAAPAPGARARRAGPPCCCVWDGAWARLAD